MYWRIFLLQNWNYVMPTKMLSLGWYKGRGQAMFKGLLFFFLSTIDTKHSVPQNQKLYFNSFYLAGERLKRKIKALRFVRIMRFSKAFSKKLYFWLSCMITQPNFCSAFNWAIYILEFALDIAWGYYYFPSWVCLFAGEFFLKRHLRILFKHLFCGWDALNALFTFSFTLNDSTVSLIQWKKICIIQTQKRSWYFLQPEGMRLGAHFSFQNQVTKCDSKEDTSINFIPKTGSYRIAACLVKMVSYVESVLWNLSNASKTEGY